jgi:phage terminase large subunit-like protein
MSEAMKEMEKLVLQKLLAHGNCPILTWMVSNVVAQLDKKDNIYPTKERVENKIDGVVALIMAISRAIGGGDDQEPPSPWEDENFSING